MSTPIRTFMSAVVVSVLAVGVGQAQAPPANQPAVPAASAQTTEEVGPLVSLMVQIVISRFQGEKKVSSLPYTLSVNANDGRFLGPGQYAPNNKARLRMGAQVPVPVAAGPVVDGKPFPTSGPIQYRDVGVSIDCSARTIDGGRFKVEISLADTSVYSDGQTAQGAPRLNDIPTFRTMTLNNTVILKDGQSTQFIVATDKISGETTKADVTVTVVK